MSTPIPGPTPTPAAPKPTPPATPPAAPAPQGTPASEEALREPGRKALDAEREARATAEKALADLRKEIEDAQKTAEQKAADDLKAAQSDSATNAAKALRYEVAADKGLDLKLAARLSGTSREEIEADAEELMKLIPKTEQPATTAPAPQPVPTVTKTPASPSGNVPIKDQIAAAEAAGSRDLVAALKAMQLTQS